MPGAGPSFTEVDGNGQYIQATSIAVITSGQGAAVVVKGSPGRLNSVVITAVGTGTLTLYDNATAASGTVLYTFAASALGVAYPLSLPFRNGLTVAAPASSPAVTIAYS